MNRKNISLLEIKEQILLGNQFFLGKAITLIESEKREDKILSEQLLETILPYTGNSIRIGITGIPGVGKSTFLESFGKIILEKNEKIAILTVDPSSPVNGGSILADRTRMIELSKESRVFIRTSPSGKNNTGITYSMSECILLCEAAGYSCIFIETAGVGQSQVDIKNIVDFFLLLTIGGAGDELQGMKKGIMEMADLIVITKADGDMEKIAQRALLEYKQVLSFLQKHPAGWEVSALLCSSLSGLGLPEIWNSITQYKKQMTQNGFFLTQRRKQTIEWMKKHLLFLLEKDVWDTIDPCYKEVQKDVLEGKKNPIEAAKKIFDFYKNAK